MKTTLLYPLTTKTLPFVKYWHSFFPKCELKLSTFCGTGLVGRPAGYAMGYSQPDQIVQGEEDLPLLVEQTEEIILLPVEEPYINSELAGTIAYITNLADKFQKQLTDYFTSSTLSLPYEIFKYPENKLLRDIPIPVIFVGGLSDDAWVEEAFLALTIGFKQCNVPISAFSCRSLLSLIGCHLLPTPTQMRNSTAEQNIKSLNDYIFTTALKDRAEAVVLHISDPLLAYNSLVTHGFGIAAYELSKATLPDFILLSLPNNLAEEDVVFGISNECERSYGQRVNCITTENTVLDPINTFKGGRIKKIILCEDSKKTPSSLSDGSHNISAINLTESDASQALVQCILEEFGGGEEE